MTRLLVSVRNAAEARVAALAGVDLIDVKEPLRGPLGRADWQTIRQVVDVVQRATPAHAIPVSIALGELADPAEPIEPPMCFGVSFAKFGLAGCEAQPDWRARWTSAAGQLPPSVGSVAVVYADWRAASAPSPDAVLEAAERLGCRAALVDTFDKNAGGLVDHWSHQQIGELVRAAQSLGLLAVVGGGLKRADIRAIARLGPDYVAVRGAACQGDRAAAICPRRVRQLVALVRQAREDRPAAAKTPAEKFGRR
jgi:hypothetical protein